MAEAPCDQLFFADGVDAEEDLFGILEAWEGCDVTPRPGAVQAPMPSSADAAAHGHKRPHLQGGCGDGGYGAAVQEPAKRQRCSAPAAATTTGEGGAAKTTTTTPHVAVERNRRKQMNGHLAVLRSLMPCFYVKRGDQASIIGGVVDYIKELQQLLQSLEAKKQRKAYTDQQVLSPRPPLRLSKSTPPMSPRLAVVPISPRTPPTPSSSPYKLCRHPSSLPLPPPPGSAPYASPVMTPTSHQESSAAASASYLPSLDAIAAGELCAYNRQPGGAVVLPEVKVEFSGANLVVKTVSQRAPGQAVKVIAALEGRQSLEILHAKISTVDDTAVNTFTIKIGIECDLSAEELVQEIQQAFS